MCRVSFFTLAYNGPGILTFANGGLFDTKSMTKQMEYT